MEDLQLQAPKFWYLTLAGPIVSALVTAANTSVSKVILLTVIESIHMIFELIVFLVIGSVSATFASKCQQHISNVDRSVLVSSGNALLDQYQGLKSGFQFGLFLMLTSKTAILTLQVKYFIKCYILLNFVIKKEQSCVQYLHLKRNRKKIRLFVSTIKK